VLDDCIQSEDGIVCLKSKAILLLDWVARMDSIPLFTGVSLTRQQELISEMPTISEAQLETRQVSLGIGAARTTDVIKWFATVWPTYWPTTHLSWTSLSGSSKKVW
jgi:hypothetical protein